MSIRKFLKKVGVTSQREIETAVRDAVEAGKKKPRQGAGRARDAYARKQQIDRAIADHDDALRLDPALADMLNARGELWLAKGDRAARWPISPRR